MSVAVVSTSFLWHLLHPELNFRSNAPLSVSKTFMGSHFAERNNQSYLSETERELTFCHLSSIHVPLIQTVVCSFTMHPSSIYTSIHLFIHLSICTSIHLSIPIFHQDILPGMPLNQNSQTHVFLFYAFTGLSASLRNPFIRDMTEVTQYPCCHVFVHRWDGGKGWVADRLLLYII